MSLRLSGYVVIGGTTPSEDPVTRGYIWMDTATDKLKICTSVSPYTFVEITGAGGASAWGAITGTLSSQTDLQAALDAKATLAHHTQHEGGGSDPILLSNLPGSLGPEQTVAGTPFVLMGFDSGGGGTIVTPTATIVVANDPGTTISVVPSAIKLDDLGAPDDNSDLDVSSTKHGLTPKSPADATMFLNGAAIPAYALVKDSDLSTSDIATNNATSSKHGFCPKLSGTSTTFLNGNGLFATPGGTNIFAQTTEVLSIGTGSLSITANHSAVVVRQLTLLANTLTLGSGSRLRIL